VLGQRSARRGLGLVGEYQESSQHEIGFVIGADGGQFDGRFGRHGDYSPARRE
jgi:hypothetical protein